MRRFLSFILMFLLILNMVPMIGIAANGNGNVEPPLPVEVEPDPRLYVSSNKTFTGEAGDSFRIPVTIRNEGDGYARNISVRADFTGNGEVYIDGPGYDSIPQLRSGQSRNVSFDVKIDKAAPNGTYTLTIKVDYENWNGSKVESTTETLNVRVSTKATSAQLTITRTDIMPSNTINAGDNFVVGFELTNKGDAPARDVKLSINGLSNDTFTLSSGLNNKTAPSIEPGKKTYLYFELRSSIKLPAGSQELEMKYTYKDSKGELVEETNKFYVEVRSNADRASSLVMEKLTYPTGTLGQNKEVDVNFSLRNQGQMEAKNIVVTAESQDPSGLVSKTVSVLKVPTIAPGETKEMNFKYLTVRGGATNFYPVNISIVYTDDVGSYDLSQYIGVFVVAPAEPGPPVDPIKSTPRLIIDRYDFDPTLVPAGENFKMNLSFFNTNSTKTVKNIKIFLTSDEKTDPSSNSGGGSVFTPVDSSNTFYIDSIPPNGRVEKTITMYTVPDAQAKMYELVANFEYEDNKGEAYTATELIGIPVIQQSRLETGELGVYPEAFIGQPAPVSIEFFNTGKVTLYNMMVKLEGDFQTENGSYYIGNFPSGSSEYFEGMVVPFEPGELTGDLVFTYEDSTGQEQEIRKPFTLNVMEEPPMPEFPGEEYPPMEEEGGMFSRIIKSPWLWGILIIIGGIVGFTVHKKKKKEKEFDLDE
ncbi:MAG: hypothetical protein GX787_05925 [Tissierellia bacterium]|nr:hypothetical protein [Tissierellia bacterium]